ncbi:MAG: hypothetical protein J6K43_13900 [Lachnospiraceae bacterium]|nr:hypothetical protein [Lachnospiraceae bacterium]
MKLLIKQRVFSWTDTYDIYDEFGNAKYFVKAEFLALGHQLHVYDAGLREIGRIQQRIISFLPTFDIATVNGIEGSIQKKFTLFHPEYEVNYNGYRVEGDFLGWEYDVYQGSSVVMHISKELLNWGDTYVIDILNPRDEILGLMLVIAIDAANCSKKND